MQDRRARRLRTECEQGEETHMALRTVRWLLAFPRRRCYPALPLPGWTRTDGLVSMLECERLLGIGTGADGTQSLSRGLNADVGPADDCLVEAGVSWPWSGGCFPTYSHEPSAIQNWQMTSGGSGGGPGDSLAN